MNEPRGVVLFKAGKGAVRPGKILYCLVCICIVEVVIRDPKAVGGDSDLTVPKTNRKNAPRMEQLFIVKTSGVGIAFL